MSMPTTSSKNSSYHDALNRKYSKYESSFTTLDRSEIFFQQWRVDSPRGVVLITHGLAEHSDCYEELAHALNGDCWDVFAWDLRGHGRSSGKRGYITHFDDFVSDLVAFNNHLSQYQLVFTNQPKIFFGHSLGGLIVLKALIENNLGVTAACLSAPALGLALRPPLLKVMAAKWVSRWLPWVTLGNEIKYTQLTQNFEKIKLYDKDPLRHDRISPRLFLGMIENFDYVRRELPDVDLPFLFQIPGKDTIIDSESSLGVCQKLNREECRVEVYSQSCHEIFNDLERDQAIQDLREFINSFV